MAYEILPPEDEGGRYEILPPEPTKRRTLAEELKRQAGLTVRYGAEGLASLPGIFIDPFQKLAGAKTMSEATSDVLTRLGLPKPETGAEEISGAISKAVAGTGPLTRAAAAIPEGLARLAPKFRGGEGVRNILAEKPLAQIAQAGIGGGAAEITKQAGGGELAQLVASAMAPLGVSGAADITSRVVRGGRELVRPVTQGGAKQVAADVLGQVVSDKTMAIQNLERYEALRERGAIGVPGSKPTAGAVSADYGLIGGEQLAARGPSNPEFAARYATSNEARLAHLAKLRANEEQIAAYTTRRETITAPLREQAFKNAEIAQTAGYQVANAVDYRPVVEKVMRLIATPEGGGRIESRKALEWVAQQIGTHLREGRIDPRNAYELHKDIGELVRGKIQTDKGPLRLAAGLANDVKKTLGAEINRAAPGFNKYLETYSRLSKPIDRLEVITEKLGGEALARVTNATPLVGPGGPQFGLSQAKMRQQVGNIENALPVSPQGLPLAPYQRDVLGRVMGDLNSEALAARGGKMPGSDTYQNMATANLLSSIFGKTLGEAGVPKLVSGPFNFAYRPLEQRIRNIVDEAYLDPKKMAELLKIARTKRNTPTLGELLTSAEQNIYGGLLGGVVSQ